MTMLKRAGALAVMLGVTACTINPDVSDYPPAEDKKPSQRITTEPMPAPGHRTAAPARTTTRPPKTKPVSYRPAAPTPEPEYEDLSPPADEDIDLRTTAPLTIQIPGH